MSVWSQFRPYDITLLYSGKHGNNGHIKLIIPMTKNLNRISNIQHGKKPQTVTLSKATEYNWKKLKSNPKDKLTKRANKTQSNKYVIANSYLNDTKVNGLLDVVSGLDCSLECIMYSLVISLLTNKNIIHKQYVLEFLKHYQNLTYINIPVDESIWNTQEDVLGFIYQSLLTEGERNITGQYYTGRLIVKCMLDGKVLDTNETFLDPCCGSGAFLLEVTTDNPSNLYGFDINPIAVMIASANLLSKYSHLEFTPHVYCVDYLKKGVIGAISSDVPFKFDNIYTNPPWGSDKSGIYTSAFPMIKSKEKASMVLVESLARLKDSGTLYFLLPTSLLKIKTHSDIRKYLLSSTTIRQIDLYDNKFDGVFTDFFSIKLNPRQADNQTYIVTNFETKSEVHLSEQDKRDGNIIIEPRNALDESIMYKMDSMRHDDLTHSHWALGIVTGDNKNKVKKENGLGLEPVYSGKQVKPFSLCEGDSYISFAPESFQQCAKAEYFRAPEKLIYRFIAKYPIVAYDDKQCLCLNSANILIPDVDSISTKSVAALLNSTLYRYYYSMKFSDIKVLKGNLQKLPFPKLSAKQDHELTSLVSSIQINEYSDDFQHRIDSTVYSIFNITPAEQSYIQTRI